MESPIIQSLTCGSIFLLAFISFTNPRKVNTVANKWFALFLFSFACALLDGILRSQHMDVQFPRIQALTEITRFAMSPAMYLSVLYFTSPDRHFKRRDYLHFIPFVIFSIYLVGHILNIQIAIWFNFSVNFNRYFGLVMFYSIKIQALAYWLLCYIRLTKHQKNIRLFASNVEPIKLNWLVYLLWGLALTVFLWFNELFFKIEFIIAYTPVGYLIATYLIGYFSFRQSEIFPYASKDVVDIKEIIKEKQENLTSKQQPRLAPGQLADLKNNLLHFMVAEKIFLDQQLGLPQLAGKMGISSHELSYLLNEGFGENFFQFINKYRVEEAKRLLISPNSRHLNVLGIAYESGFGSKTTFNTTFKKFTGQSPSQFQKSAMSPGTKE